MMNSHDTDIPADIQSMAARLAEAGAAARAGGENAAYRVALRTARLLHEEAPAPRIGASGLARFWMWLAAPATVLAAVAIAFVMAQPGHHPSSDGGSVAAARLETDIDTWLALDEVLREETFENRLAVLSLDTAGVATRSDDADSLPRLESGS
ncbi:MAG: hypothetical protein IPJ41_09070 [Phycisphaerales bacterium]|nr:hypothetical protein [Phycisphaerales bacterium]